jgi:hypothetical protein
MPHIPKMPRKKDKFDALDPEFKDKVAALSAEEINNTLAQVAKDQEALEQAKEDDEDFQAKKEAAKEAGEVYREGRKVNRLKIQFCVRVLRDMGKT